MIIRNSPVPNFYGDGNQKEIIDEKTGKRYIVRNRPVKNFYGDDEYQQEIIELGGSSEPVTAEDVHNYSLFMGYGSAFLMCWVIGFLSTSHLFEWTWWLAVGITAFVLIKTILKDIAAFLRGLYFIGAMAGLINSFIAFLCYCTG